MPSPEVIPLEFTSHFYLSICHFSVFFFFFFPVSPHKNKPLDLTRCCQILATRHKLLLDHERSQVVIPVSGPALLLGFSNRHLARGACKVERQLLLGCLGSQCVVVLSFSKNMVLTQV